MSTISAGQWMTTAEQEALAQVFRKTQGPAASNFYMALLTNAASGSVDNTWTTMASPTEYVPTGYARQIFTPATPTVASPSVGSNNGAITYGPFTAGTGGTVVWGMGTDATGAGSGATAKLMIAFLLALARTPLIGDSLQAASGSFTSQV